MKSLKELHMIEIQLSTTPYPPVLTYLVLTRATNTEVCCYKHRALIYMLYNAYVSIDTVVALVQN